MELVSIIVPIYNTEEYIDKCVESIINQTYKEIEIILIDDGSTDNSPILCDKWEEKDKRIHVIHLKNGGVSRARNIGLKNANGKYISFIDSDDYVESNFIEVMIEEFMKEKADIVISKFCKVYEDCTIMKQEG